MRDPFARGPPSRERSVPLNPSSPSLPPTRNDHLSSQLGEIPVHEALRVQLPTMARARRQDASPQSSLPPSGTQQPTTQPSSPPIRPPFEERPQAGAVAPPLSDSLSRNSTRTVSVTGSSSVVSDSTISSATPVSTGQITSSSSDSTSSGSSSTAVNSRPWTYTATPSKTTSGSAASETTFVPGVIFNMTLGGTSDDQAVYSVPMTFGHYSGYRKKRSQKRGPMYQVMDMQVDLGSSDMWVAVKGCNTADCKSAARLYDEDESLPPDHPMYLTLSYAQGSVSGGVMWEQVTLGLFGIAYQAFLAADNVYNEDLGGGQFQGLLGLALPANSVIEDSIPGTTSSNPDGATFLDNLFGAGASAPSQRMFSLSLERREDSRTLSTFGVGAVDERLCPYPCALDFMPIIPHANLGKTGYLHWRVPLLEVKAHWFADPARGKGISSKVIELGPSLTDAAQPNPLAVLDSGGVAILVGSKTHADAIYGAYGISASSDGLYRMACTVPLTFSFTLGNNEFYVHPLDMTWPDPTDPSKCVGAIQVSQQIAHHGDFVLGSTFMKNVYSVFKYPDQRGSGRSWQPTVGLSSLVNSSIASSDFYAVRNQHKSLTTVSGGGVNPFSPFPSGVAEAAQKRVASTALIAACSVVGFFVLAAGAFCAWWFWLRRKVGDNGIVEYKMAAQVNHHQSDNSMSTLRSRKHEETKRQKSLVDGFSDYDEDSWMGIHDGGGSAIGLMSMRDREDNAGRLRNDSNSTHGRHSSLHQSLLAHDSLPDSPMSDFFPRQRHRSSSSDMLLADRRISRDSRIPERPLSSADACERRISSNGSRSTAGEPSRLGRLIDHDSAILAPSRSSPDIPTLSSSINVPNSGISLPHSQRSPSMTTSHMSPSLSMAGPFPSNSGRLSAHGGIDSYFPALPVGSETLNLESQRDRRPSTGDLH